MLFTSCVRLAVCVFVALILNYLFWGAAAGDATHHHHDGSAAARQRRRRRGVSAGCRATGVTEVGGEGERKADACFVVKARTVFLSRDQNYKKLFRSFALR